MSIGEFLLKILEPKFLFQISWISALVLAGAVLSLTLLLFLLKKWRIFWNLYRNRRANYFTRLIYEFADAHESLFQNIAIIQPLKHLNWIDRKILEETILTLSETFAGTWGERLCFLFDELGFAEIETQRTLSVFSFIRARAARRLGQMKSRKAVPALTLLLNDDSNEVKINAAEALSRIGALESLPLAVESLAEYSKIAAIQVAELVKSASKAAVPILLQMCEHPDSAVQLFAIQLLGLVNDSRSKATLLKLYNSENMELRIACLKALQTLKEEEFFVAFLPRIRDLSIPWQERAQIAKMLGAAECLQAIPDLQKSMCDKNWWVRKNAGEALMQMGKKGLHALQEVANFPDRFARDMAAQCLDELSAS